jgi:chemotaxis signal transduction protein
MAKYKDMTVPRALSDIIPHMKEVDSYREELTILGQAWDLLTILGRMSGGGTDMTSTREDFRDLTEKLIISLGNETLSKTIMDITSKAQVTVDIIIRNLFERTADIGFLATDDDIRQYLRSHPSLEKMVANLNSDVKTTLEGPSKAQLIERFNEYVAKYSVYHNIILLDTKGNVLAQLDENNPINHSDDPIIYQALNTHDEYVERFEKTDLDPQKEESLIYAYRVTDSNEANSQALGVLCLCFRFENEMQGIFNNLSGSDDWSVLTLLDKSGKVIASSSPYQIPTNAHLDLILKDTYRITQFAGRRYLAKTLDTKGYQGFSGLGWKGHVMIPLDVAFENSNDNVLEHVDQSILHSIMNNSQVFSSEIQHIPIEADLIQSELDRTVWNGNISSQNRESAQSASATKVLLWEISRTGNKTKNVFSRAIRNLHETIVSTYMSDVEFMASLAIDIMDRNLYERANDCRWWALTSEFSRILSLSHIDAAEAAKAEKILQYINNLYTVYTNLVLYDRSGKVIAVSNPDESALVGKSLNKPWTDATLKITNTQDYSVSAFEPTPLYQNKPTYIYNSSIQDPENKSRILGGIGIVFDSEPQFKAMLEDSLPRDKTGELVSGCFAVFVDEQAHVISSSKEEIEVGSLLNIDQNLLTSSVKQSHSAIIEFEDTYYALGIRVSNGYREYKSKQDNYKNTVFALVFMELDKAQAASSSSSASLLQADDGESENSLYRTLTENYTEVATFYIGEQWYGIEVSHVVEAIKVENITTIPGEIESVVGTCFYDGEAVLILDPLVLLGKGKQTEEKQIVIIETGYGRFGILANRLGKIPRIDNARLSNDNSLFSKASRTIKHIVSPEKSDKSQKILIILDPVGVYRALSGEDESDNNSAELPLGDENESTRVLAWKNS